MDISKKKNRPDMRDLIPRRVMFYGTSSTGWGRIRQLGNYKGDKSEKNFNHLHARFWGEGDDPL